MIITRTPVRISLLGGGTDYPVWFRENGGMVVGGAINKYSYISARYLPPFHSYQSRFVYSEIEHCESNSVVAHNAIRATLDYLGLTQPDSPGLEVTHCSDLPAKSGTGSSSTFVVGLLHAISALEGRLMLPHDLATAAIEIEQQRLNETVGCQDQTFAAYGGLNVIKFRHNGDISVQPLGVDFRHIEELESHLMLFFTKISRISSNVAKSYATSLAEKKKEQFAMMRLAEEGISAIHKKKWDVLGRLMDNSWRIKAGLSNLVTNDTIDSTYIAARLAGAFGGKITGAGGGGCMLLVVPPEKRQSVIEALPNCVYIPFNFEFDGSTIIFSDKYNMREYRNARQ